MFNVFRINPTITFPQFSRPSFPIEFSQIEDETKSDRVDEYIALNGKTEEVGYDPV